MMEAESVFDSAVERFVEHLRVCNYSAQTMRDYRKILGYFGAFLSELYVCSATSVRERHIRLWQGALVERQVQGRPFSVASQRRYLSVLQSFFRYLHRAGRVAENPALKIELPRPDRQLPRGVLEVSEMRRLLEQPDLTTPLGVRNRAILELFYSCGIRAAELIGLTLDDVNREGCELIVLGKGHKEAVVPFGRAARSALDNWLTFARPRLVRAGACDALFVSRAGRPLTGSEVRLMLRLYGKAAGIDKRCSPHSLRHSCATHLLKGGADVRYIQKLLRHATLNTTQIYTRVDVSDLKEAQRRYHPREQQYYAVE